MSMALTHKVIKMMEKINELEERIEKLEAENKPKRRRKRKTEDVTRP